MTWSYSRLTCYDDCKYKWFLKYIKEIQEQPMFYSSYGKFMHEIIEGYYKGTIGLSDMKIKYLTSFSESVEGARPQKNVVDKYIKAGSLYLENFKPFPFNTIAVEKRIKFKINSTPFESIVDYIGEADGSLYIIDNKSRDLKERSKRSIPTKKDIELDDMLKQLYIYSAAVKHEYGVFPSTLCFNCFKSGVFVKEPFVKNKYEETMLWVNQKIQAIKETDFFNPDIEYFKCNYLCGVKDECCYFRGGSL